MEAGPLNPTSVPPTRGGKTKVGESFSTNTTSTDPRNRAQFERYLDDCARQMEKPHVSNAELKEYMDNLYRPGAKIGSGSTADAARFELKTGKKVSGRDHVVKAEQRLQSLVKWVENNQCNPKVLKSDLEAARNVIRDLRNSLNGK